MIGWSECQDHLKKRWFFKLLWLEAIMTKLKIKKTFLRACVSLIEISCVSSDLSKLFFCSSANWNTPQINKPVSVWSWSKTDHVCKLWQSMVIKPPPRPILIWDWTAGLLVCPCQVTIVCGQQYFGSHCSQWTSGHQDSSCISSHTQIFLWKVKEFPIQTKVKIKRLRKLGPLP